jgi:hypothetical protein
VVAVDEAKFRIGVAESLASTPSKTELEVVSQSLSKQEVVARKDAAKVTSFGKKNA